MAARTTAGFRGPKLRPERHRVFPPGGWLVFAALCWALPALTAPGAVIARWDFNSVPPDTDATTGTLEPAAGVGTARLVGGVTGSFTASNGSGDPAPDNSNWRVTTWPAQGTGNKQHGIEFRVSTAGASNLVMMWDQRNSNTASKYARIQYTTNGADFIDYQVVTMPAETWINGQAVSFLGGPGVDDNPRFAVRILTEFQSTATGSGPAAYATSNPGSTYGPAGTLRFDRVEFSAWQTPREVSFLSYNIYGGSVDDTAENWSTNSARIQAVGRVLRHLQPDIVGFQEFSNLNTWQLTNLVRAFLPGYYMAADSTTAGGLRDVTVSRFPILRSQSWLARTPLDAFGFDGVFTRDLFEAEIAVPGFPAPIHVFNVHLKAFADATNSVRRGAEARCISNWFVTTFLAGPARHDPYALLGDMNEDVTRPRVFEQDAIGTLTSAATGLRLTSPLNPVTQSEKTWNTTNATIRFDYVLPNGLLYSNLAGGQVFRSDQSNPQYPVPAWMPANTTQVAADHLPVWLACNVPAWPFRITSATRAGNSVTLQWETQVNARYRVQASSNAVHWVNHAGPLSATTTNLSWTGNSASPLGFFRILRD